MLAVEISGLSARMEQGWIGASVEFKADAVLVQPQPAKISAAAALTIQLAKRPIVTVKQLQSYAGQLNFMAGIVPFMYPFIHPLWAVIYDKGVNTLPAHLRHAKRCKHEFAWLHALLQHKPQAFVREFMWGDRVQEQLWMRISIDASPWGIGGILYDKDWHPTAYFYEKTSAADISRFGIVPGKSEHMPVLEALALLVAVRLWAPRAVGFTYHVRTDNLGSTFVLEKLRSANQSLNKIAAELALDMAEQLYKPMRITHIPGVTNSLPDLLSRLGAPGAKVMELPKSLANAVHVQIVRDASYWKSDIAQLMSCF